MLPAISMLVTTMMMMAAAIFVIIIVVLISIILPVVGIAGISIISAIFIVDVHK